jgi:hypothetical protein
MVMDAIETALLAGPGSTAHSIVQTGGAVIRHSVRSRRDCPRCGSFSSEPASLHAHCGRRTGIVATLDLTDRPVAGAFRATAVWTPPLPASRARFENPSAAEIVWLRAQTQFVVQQRISTMTPAERQQFDRLMKPQPRLGR